MRSGIPKTAALVVRVWCEGPDQGDFRARITRSADLAEADALTSVTSYVDGVLEIVQAWLQEFLEAYDRGPR